MKASKSDFIAEELGAVLSIIETLRNNYQLRASTNAGEQIDQIDKTIFLEYARGYIENCFRILAHELD